MLSSLDAFAIASQIKGWMKRTELEWLYKLATKQEPECKWVEVGSWKGRSAMMVSCGLPVDSFLHLVDPLSNEKQPKAHSELSFPLDWSGRNLQMAVNYISDLHVNTFVRWHRETSVEAAVRFEDKSCDVVFIDAAHDYDSVFADIKAWEPKVKDGGVLCGHDYAHKGVRQAVQSTVHPIKKGAGSIWWTRV